MKKISLSGKIALISFLVYFILSCSEMVPQPEKLTPLLSFSTTRINEGFPDAQLAVHIRLLENIDTTVTVKYSTNDSTARSEIDFQGIKDGILYINPPETTETIYFTVLDDDHLEFTEQFMLSVNYEYKGIITKKNLTIDIADNDAYKIEEDRDGFITPASYPDMKLIFEETFDSDTLNGAYWDLKIGDGCPDQCGWGKDEKTYYTALKENFIIKEGIMSLLAQKDNPAYLYTSSKISSQSKFHFKYGRIDIRAILPEGKGLWPYIRLVGVKSEEIGLPEGGEIGVMEAIGEYPLQVMALAHFKNDHQNLASGNKDVTGNLFNLQPGQSFNDKFHVFTLIWEPDNIKWYVDYLKFFEINSAVTKDSYPFNDFFYFDIGLAVGGAWPGDPYFFTPFPQSMQIDYIRIFQ